MAGAEAVNFRHNDLDDLEAKLVAHAEKSNKLVVTEGVYCLEGEIIDGSLQLGVLLAIQKGLLHL